MNFVFSKDHIERYTFFYCNHLNFYCHMSARSRMLGIFFFNKKKKKKKKIIISTAFIAELYV